MTYKIIDFLNNNAVTLLVIGIVLYLIINFLRQRKKYFEIIKKLYKELLNGSKQNSEDNKK